MSSTPTPTSSVELTPGVAHRPPKAPSTKKSSCPEPAASRSQANPAPRGDNTVTAGKAAPAGAASTPRGDNAATTGEAAPDGAASNPRGDNGNAVGKDAADRGSSAPPPGSPAPPEGTASESEAQEPEGGSSGYAKLARKEGVGEAEVRAIVKHLETLDLPDARDQGPDALIARFHAQVESLGFQYTGEATGVLRTCLTGRSGTPKATHYFLIIKENLSSLAGVMPGVIALPGGAQDGQSTGLHTERSFGPRKVGNCKKPYYFCRLCDFYTKGREALGSHLCRHYDFTLVCAYCQAHSSLTQETMKVHRDKCTPFDEFLARVNEAASRPVRAASLNTVPEIRGSAPRSSAAASSQDTTRVSSSERKTKKLKVKLPKVRPSSRESAPASREPAASEPVPAAGKSSSSRKRKKSKSHGAGREKKKVRKVFVLQDPTSSSSSSSDEDSEPADKELPDLSE